MSAAGHPPPEAEPRGWSPAGSRFRLGNLRCEVIAADSRYAALLATAYGTALLTGRDDTVLPPDLSIHVRDDPRPAPVAPGDRLIVSRALEVTVLHSDPMTWEVRADGRPRRISVAVHDPALPDDLLGYHFWILLNRTLLLLDRVTLHAAALAYRGSVSLFAGPKGAGKSTIAVALARAGAALLADDHVVARREGTRLCVSGCNGRLRVTAKTEEHFLAGVLPPPTLDVAGMPKKEFAADRFFVVSPHEERLADRLFLPRPGPRFAIRPARRQAALLRLVEDTGAMLRFHDRADYSDFLAALADLVELLPCYELELSPRLADLDRLVEFLDREA